MRVLSCDAQVHAVKRVSRASQIELLGGGGTDMGEGIAQALSLKPRPSVIVVLTDGFTPWPAGAPRGAKVIVGLLEGRPGAGLWMHIPPRRHGRRSSESVTRISTSHRLEFAPGGNFGVTVDVRQRLAPRVGSRRAITAAAARKRLDARSARWKPDVRAAGKTEDSLARTGPATSSAFPAAPDRDPLRALPSANLPLRNGGASPSEQRDDGDGRAPLTETRREGEPWPH